jgi:pimeloyl-ACP methyl ester carboxylesterase
MKFLLTSFLLWSLLSCVPKPPTETTEDFSFLGDLHDATDIVAGSILVPEDYEKPSGKKIRITYAVLKAKTQATKQYPVIHFTGGPGGESLAAIGRWVDNPIRDERDLIIFDQRGIGYSNKLTDMSEPVYKILASDLTIAQESKMTQDTISFYHKQLIDNDVCLECYTIFNNAADVNELMKKLGYEKYNLYGESYGTRLARVVMDRYGEKINSVILDAPAILNKDFLTFRLINFNNALEKLFMYCESDPNCSLQYPMLRQDYVEALKQLEQEPIEATLDDRPFFINPQDAIYLVRYHLYRFDALTSTPAFIQALKTKDIYSINASGQWLRSVIVSGNLSSFISAERHEEYDETLTENEFEALYKTLPHLPAKLGFFSSLHTAIKHWHSKSMIADERKLNVSTIPTIIFVNKYDPVTPPENGFDFAEKLSNSRLFVLDQAGHGATTACAREVMINFMNNTKTFDSSCLNVEPIRK